MRGEWDNQRIAAAIIMFPVFAAPFVLLALWLWR